jgi:tetratricopeptide (TPR) repeat protein
MPSIDPPGARVVRSRMARAGYGSGMKKLAVIAVAIALAACKPKETPPVKQANLTPTSSAKPGSAASSGAASQPASRPSRHAAVAKANPDFVKHVRAGWKAQKDDKWADAVVEFEAALKITPDDQKALAELGWSAMKAGDFDKAKKADQKAIDTAKDNNVKAMALYNLGSVLAKTGDKEGALRLFVQSLALRPNKNVEKAVLDLGAKPETPVAMCKAGQAPCDCLRENDEDTCEEVKDYQPAVPAGYHVFHEDQGRYSFDALFDDKLRFVTDLGADTDRTHVSGTDVVKKLEVKKVGGHQVLRVEIDSSSSTAYASAGETGDFQVLEEDSAYQVTLCVLGNETTPPSCPLVVPLEGKHSKSYDPLDTDSKEKPPAGEEHQATLDLQLADDGTATVKLVKGDSAGLEALMGPHRLW